MWFSRKNAGLIGLSEIRIKSHLAHLNSMAFIEDYERKFIRTKLIKYFDESTRAEIFIENFVFF